MRIPGQIRNAEEDFRQALVNTRHPAAPEPLKLCHGQALKELGFYYRQTGDWTKASEAYFEALRVTPLQDQEERASIQSNWAYVQALRGRYQEALDLVEAALTVRRRRDLRRGVGMALSIKGEVYRYARDFVKAWQAYQEAESIFQELGDWPWLGLIRQEQAICLFQADQTQQFLTGYENSEQMLQAARSLALQALDLCRDRSIRAYPSALNRAGRIFGYDDPEKGIEYIEEGIRWAKEVADGWFWFANLIEFIDLNYKIGDLEHRTRIEVRAPEVEEVKVDYDFPDLSGRWELLQGHLKVCNALTTTNQEEQLKWLSQALEHYKRGFPLLTKGFVGSHGAHGIPGEFKRFIEILGKLPVMTRDAWCKELQRAWGDPALGYIEEPKQSTSLLARLTEVYETLVAQPSEGPTAES
jgi:tetratricopeptide (TPR) repeat protein